MRKEGRAGAGAWRTPAECPRCITFRNGERRVEQRKCTDRAGNGGTVFSAREEVCKGSDLGLVYPGHSCDELACKHRGRAWER